MILYNNIILSKALIFVICLSIFFISSAGIFLYRKIAVKNGILANPNFRTLHETPIPTGGGIVLALVFIISIFILWWYEKLSDDIFKILFIGGGAAVLFGFLDDLKNINSIKKLTFQILLSSWTLFCLHGGPLLDFQFIPPIIAIFLSIFFLVWVINAYNFMDGIDGIAIFGATFFSGLLAFLMLISNGSSELTLIFLLLMSCSAALMFFNWPPASIFMGDAGSIFLGYFFGAIILITVMNGDISIWTWLVVFGYFFADTTMTQIMRLILVKKWYKPHRSHAYQNLARLSNSHFRVTLSVIVYHLVWIVPLSIWTIIQPDMAIIAAAFSILPGLLVTYKYGPALSSS